MKGINRLALIFTKILEITHWVAAGLMAAAGVCAVFIPRWLGYFIDLPDLKENTEIEVYGFEVNVAGTDGGLDMTAFLLFAIGAVLIFILMAMIFRNLYRIIKRSENTTPFQKDNIRMLKEIGIFSMVIPVVGLVMSMVISLAAGAGNVELSIDLGGFVMGIIVLCLTQFFVHGAELEKDVDGLL